MVNDTLAFNWGGLFAVIALVFCAFIIALVIMCLIRVSRYFMNAGKEQKLIRIEIGKLAEEVHLLRQELKPSEKGSVDKIE
ncbi:MAG: hypothetical protein ACYST6_07735 [Planctomycetota bacterium]